MILKKSVLVFLSLCMMVSPLAHDDNVIISLIDQNREAVVSVRGESKQSANRWNNLFERYFGMPPLLNPPNQQPRQPRQPLASIGSGVIIEADGHILTNAHVVDGLSDITVTTADGSEYPAKLIGTDKLTDIALLKIETDKPLQIVKIGDSDKVRVGQYVLAIGSPFGLEQTVTSGIISALHRNLPSELYVPFIQTDAAVNPGNSGGPLINLQGEVIGINSQIISPVRAFAGLSFAIPINRAMDIQQRLRKDGVIRRGRLGVYFRPVTEADVKALGLPSKKGALINEVVRGSAAAEAGLQSSDVLLSVNGNEIADSIELPRLIGGFEPSEEVQLELFRQGETITVSAVLGAIETEVPVALTFGLRVETLTGEIRQQTGVRNGVIIVGIEYDDEMPKDIGQLRQGDIIMRITAGGRHEVVTDKEQFVQILKDITEDAFALTVWRNGRRLVITIALDG